jgi:hypothetical protein
MINQSSPAIAAAPHGTTRSSVASLSPMSLTVAHPYSSFPLDVFLGAMQIVSYHVSLLCPILSSADSLDSLISRAPGQ